MTLALRLGHIFSTNSDDPALIYADRSHTYRDLEKKSDEVIEKFRRIGIVSGATLLLLNDKSQLCFAVMIACIRSGITFVNLDPATGYGRLSTVARLVEAQAIGQINADGELEIDILSDCPSVSSNYIPYIMFTSGSTGEPKGVVIGEAGLLNFIDWAGVSFQVEPGSRLTNLNQIYFDNSVFDFFVSVFHGAALLPITPNQLADPLNLVDSLRLLAPTHWFSVPTLLRILSRFRVLDRNNLPTLKYIIFGGEPYPKEDLKILFDEFKSQCTLVNVYGPTEITCICSSHVVTDADFNDMNSYCPIGSFIPGIYGLIVNEGGKICPPGEKGELVLGGVGVSLGYSNRPHKSSTVFKQNPLHDRYCDRVYFTGDIVAQVQENILIYGRTDNQVKINGYRVELEELEGMVSNVSSVEECMFYIETDEQGFARLNCFVISASEEDTLLSKKIADVIPRSLGDIEVRKVSGLIRGPNGKLDRQRTLSSFRDETDQVSDEGC